MRGVVVDPRLLRRAVPAGLRASFALNSARQILSRGFLTKNFGDDSLNLRFERSETFYSDDRHPGAAPVARVLPPHGADRRLAVLSLALESSALGPLHQPGRAPPRAAPTAAFDLHPVLSLPLEDDPVAVASTAQRRRPAHRLHGLDRRRRRQTFTGDSLTRDLRARPGVSLVGPSFSRIFDVEIGPCGKFKHVIEPRIDYTYVSDVSDPGAHPGLRRRSTRRSGRTRSATRSSTACSRKTGGPEGRLGGGDRLARDRADVRLHAARRRSSLPADERLRASGKTGPVEAILRIAPGRPLPARRAARTTTPIASQVINATSDRRRQPGDRTT